MKDLSNNYSLKNWIKSINFRKRIINPNFSLKWLIGYNLFILILFYLVNSYSSQRIIFDHDSDMSKMKIPEDTVVKTETIRDKQVLTLSKKVHWEPIIVFLIAYNFMYLINTKK